MRAHFRQPTIKKLPSHLFTKKDMKKIKGLKLRDKLPTSPNWIFKTLAKKKKLIPQGRPWSLT